MEIYRNGLCFECRKCGKCCVSTRRDFGVYLYLADVARISRRLGMTKETFAARYCFFRPVRKGAMPRLQVKKRGGGACAFLRRGRCRIYRVRPLLCRLGPFVRGFMESPACFRLFQRTCGGIGSGRLLSRAKIRKCLRREARLEEQYENDLAADTFLNTIFYPAGRGSR